MPDSSTAPRRGEVGDKMADGKVVTTVTGGQTTPIPKIDMGYGRKARATIERVNDWLVQNALAAARGDDFDARSFRQDLQKPLLVADGSAELSTCAKRDPTGDRGRVAVIRDDGQGRRGTRRWCWSFRRHGSSGWRAAV